MDTLGEKLKRAREAAHLNQESVAQALGTSRTLISKWERGEQEPRLHALQRLAGLYGVGLEGLVGANTPLSADP
ncbi:Helix-turn-helix type 3 domain protein, partial [mine drainage metagenome]